LASRDKVLENWNVPAGNSTVEPSSARISIVWNCFSKLGCAEITDAQAQQRSIKNGRSMFFSFGQMYGLTAFA